MQNAQIKVRTRQKARIEIIPLIDVIFFLLATFVLFTLSLNRIQAVGVTLPKPDGEHHIDETVTVQVSGDGAMFWNHEAIEARELGPRIAAYIAHTPEADRRILLASDDRARFGDAVAALDVIRAAGITQYSVETKPRPTGQ